MIYKRDFFTKCQAIHGEMYLAKSGKAFKLNEMGIRVWNLLDGRSGILDVAEAISDEFKVDKKVVERDVENFIQMLLERELIEEISQN